MAQRSDLGCVDFDSERPRVPAQRSGLAGGVQCPAGSCGCGFLAMTEYSPTPMKLMMAMKSIKIVSIVEPDSKDVVAVFDDVVLDLGS
nr:hypothetical protein [Tanacetum cinerariifolium]